MKKLIKKSLNELAEIMPVLSEKNQHECVGGTYFVDASGAFMYQNSMTDYAGQATDTIKVISGVDISGFQRAESSGTLSTFNAGTILNDVNDN